MMNILWFGNKYPHCSILPVLCLLVVFFIPSIIDAQPRPIGIEEGKTGYQIEFDLEAIDKRISFVTLIQFEDTIYTYPSMKYHVLITQFLNVLQAQMEPIEYTSELIPRPHTGINKELETLFGQLNHPSELIRSLIQYTDSHYLLTLEIEIVPVQGMITYDSYVYQGHITLFDRAQLEIADTMDFSFSGEEGVKQTLAYFIQAHIPPHKREPIPEPEIPSEPVISEEPEPEPIPQITSIDPPVVESEPEIQPSENPLEPVLEHVPEQTEEDEEQQEITYQAEVEQPITQPTTPPKSTFPPFNRRFGLFLSVGIGSGNRFEIANKEIVTDSDEGYTYTGFFVPAINGTLSFNFFFLPHLGERVMGFITSDVGINHAFQEVPIFTKERVDAGENAPSYATVTHVITWDALVGVGLAYRFKLKEKFAEIGERLLMGMVQSHIRIVQNQVGEQVPENQSQMGLVGRLGIYFQVYLMEQSNLDFVIRGEVQGNVGYSGQLSHLGICGLFKAGILF
jgi:hypothetical protein